MAETPAARLLVVDDEVLLMEALRQTLRDEGFVVEGATSGAVALEALRTGGFDLVLTDLRLPEMDGIVLLREALAIDPQLAGIIMTGHGTIPTAVDAMKVGAIDYVLKPLKLGALLPVIQRGLTMRRLRLKNIELEKRVRERTADLEAVNKDLETFAYSVSHDLRTPLRAIHGFSEILLHRGPTLPAAEVQRCVELIHRGSREMDQLINDIMAFSRLGHQNLKRQPVDLARMARDVLGDLPNDRPVDFRVQSLPAVSGDPALLRQVLVNLLSNALKFTRPREQAVIELGTPSEPGVAEPVFFVRDNGVGFDPQHASRLFGVFQRLYHSQEFEGSGVGLAIVRRIIERHGGRVWAEAVPNEGATFYFTLPAAVKTA